MGQARRFGVIATAVLAVGMPACSRSDSAREGQQAAAAAAAQQAAADSARAAAELTRARGAIATRIHYAFDRSDIGPDARAVLDSKVEALNTNPGLRIRIVGHCDERGTERYNQALGLRRAEAAKQYLVRSGVGAARMDVVSAGETRPLDTRRNRAAWALNRRAEFELLPPGGAR